MPLDLDRFELDSDDDNDIDMWCDNFWDLWLPTQRVVHNVGRSLDEILELEVALIQEHTEVDAVTWISCYAERFREILTDDPTLTKYQVKHILYYGKYINL